MALLNTNIYLLDPALGDCLGKVWDISWRKLMVITNYLSYIHSFHPAGIFSLLYLPYCHNFGCSLCASPYTRTARRPLSPGSSTAPSRRQRQHITPKGRKAQQRGFSLTHNAFTVGASASMAHDSRIDPPLLAMPPSTCRRQDGRRLLHPLPTGCAGASAEHVRRTRRDHP
jgi:hypothetical protein